MNRKRISASTIEQDDEDGKTYKKIMMVVECRRAKRKQIRLVFFLKNNLSSNRKIALNINTKAGHMPSILGNWISGWVHRDREQRCQGCFCAYIV